MTLITAPAFSITEIDWYLDQPAQVNRGGYSGSRQVVANPWHGKWRASVTLKTEQGEENFRAMRAFMTSLLGQVNTFMLPATEGPQYVNAAVSVAVSSRANTTVTNLGGGVYTVEKTGGTSGNYDASAIGASAFTGDFVVRLKSLVNNGHAQMGVNADPLTDDGYTGIDYAWAKDSAIGTQWAIQENGTGIGSFYADATYSWIWRVGSTLGYGRGTTLAAAQAAPDRTVAGAGGVLTFDSSLKTTGDKFEVMATGTLLPTAASGAAQGATAITLSGAPASLTAGMMAAVYLPSGNRQMVMLTADMASSVITFRPALREAISTGALIDVANPSCQVALAASEFGWNVGTWRLYGLKIEVEEAFWVPTLDTTAKAAVAGDFAPAWFVWLDVVGDPIRVTNFGQNVTFASTGDSDLDGNTFVSFAGQFLDVGDVSNSESGSDTLSITLSGIVTLDTALLAAIGDVTKWQGRTCRIWFQIYDAAGVTPQGGIVSHYTGYMSSISIMPGPKSQTIQLSVENYLAAFNQASNRSYLNQADYDAADVSAAATLAASNGSMRLGVGVNGSSSSSWSDMTYIDGNMM